MIRFNPGSRVPWNLPSRSTTQALCCGTMRTPSMTKATTTPITSTQNQYLASAGTNDAATASPTAAASFQSIPIPPMGEAALVSGKAFLGDLERIAIGGKDIEHGAGLERLGALDLR